MTLPESVSIVIPVYNGAATIGAVVERVMQVLRGVQRRTEIILVNDGSRDDSWPTIRALAETYPEVTGVDLTRNYGQHNALLCGIRLATHEVVVTLDDDLQQPPEEIPKLLAKLDEGFDVVYGTPEQERHGLARNISSRMTKAAFSAAMGADVASKVSAFRAFRASLKPAFAEQQNPLLNIDVLLTWATTRVAAVPVTREPRRTGTSNYRFRSLVRHAMNMMTGFSVLPLQIATLIGLLFTVFGLMVLAYVVGRYLIGGAVVPGFAFLASIIAIFSGAQLFALGIIGEYLGRMHMRTMNRPPYLVRTTTDGRV